MNWLEFRLRWPYFLLVIFCSFCTYFNSNFKSSILFLLTLSFLLFRICSKYYIPIQKPWKIYLILAVCFVFYLRLNANSFQEMAYEYILDILSIYCLACIFILLLRDPKIYDSSYIFVFNFLMLVGGSIATNKAPKIYAIEVYIITSLTIYTAIRCAPTPKINFPIRRFLWFLFTLVLIITISTIFELNNSRIENYFNRFTSYSSMSNKDTMSISSMEKIWNNNDELNKIVLRAYANEAPKHLRISTFDTFKNKDWTNTINDHDTKLDSIKIDGKFYTRLYNSPKPDFEKSDCTVYLTMMSSGQILTTDQTTWIRSNMPLKRLEANGYLGSYAGRSGYSLYHTEKRSVEKPKILDFYGMSQLNLSDKDQQYILNLSNSITSLNDSIETKVKKIHQYLLANHSYEINPKLPIVTNPIIYFLQNKTNAHCQYFSSASIFLLRAQNIPCRIASGYLCMRYNNFGEYWVSKGIDSHAWVEYYDNGWQTFDPTEGARITDETQKYLKFFSGTYDFIDFKVTLWAWQILSGEFKEYLGKKWDQLIDIILENVNLIYFLAISTLLFIVYLKFFRKGKGSNTLLLVYTPPNANKKQIVAAYLRILQILKNKNITWDTKDTLEALIKKIENSDLNNETKINFVEIITNYQLNRFKPD